MVDILTKRSHAFFLVCMAEGGKIISNSFYLPGNVGKVLMRKKDTI